MFKECRQQKKRRLAPNDNTYYDLPGRYDSWFHDLRSPPTPPPSLQARLNPLTFVACIYPKMFHLTGELKGYFIQVMSLMRLGPAQFCTCYCEINTELLLPVYYQELLGQVPFCKGFAAFLGFIQH